MKLAPYLFPLLALSACSPPAPVTDASTDAVSDTANDSSSVDATDVQLRVDAGPQLVTFTPVPRSREVEPGVIREVFTVASDAPPPNETPNRQPIPTPAEYNRVQVVRYRASTTGEIRARSVIVAMPGFLGGAGSFDPLARALVKRSIANPSDGPVEVWAIDRRSNLLEDLRGMEAAEALGDPEVAWRYYIDQSVALEGRSFGEFIRANSSAIAYMSEWGLATTLRDLRAVIQSIPDARNHVVLLGHSLGASVAEAYAGWDFDGTPGYQSIAGLVLVDGVLSGGMVSEDVYLNGDPSGGLMASPGVRALRASGPYYFALPVLGLKAVVLSEILARRAKKDPTAVTVDAERDRLLRTLLSVPAPRLTNAAAFGFGFDAASCPLGFARMSLGAPTGGPLMMVNNAFTLGGPAEMLTVPSDSTALYNWDDSSENTSLANGTSAWAATPTNFSEWYFPVRLPADIAAIGPMTLTETSWQWREGLRAKYGGQIDVPALGFATTFMGSTASFNSLRSRLSATVGTGRPLAGTDRNDPRALSVSYLSSMSHIDPLTAVDDNAQPTPRNPVPGAVAAFARTNTTGTIALPTR